MCALRLPTVLLVLGRCSCPVTPSAATSTYWMTRISKPFTVSFRLRNQLRQRTFDWLGVSEISNWDSVDATERSKLERAFNILAHTDLRNCYDALRRDEDSPPLFPYGGFGSILVEGQLSDDRVAFFGHRVLAYKPEMTSRRVFGIASSLRIASSVGTHGASWRSG